MKTLIIALILGLILLNSGYASNLIVDCAFNDLEGWNISNPLHVTISTNTVQGTSCLQLIADPDTPNGSESTAVWQMLDIKRFDPKGEYRLQFRARSDRFPQEYNLFLGLMQGENLPFTIGYEWRQVGTNWQDVQVDFRDVNPVATAVKLMIQVKSPGTVWIDDLKIEKLPNGTIGAEERLLKDLPKFKGSPDQVQITSTGQFRIKNKPFFPIGMWGMTSESEEIMDQLRDYGFNVSGGHVFSSGPDGAKVLLDRAEARGLMLVGVMRFAINGETSNTLKEAEGLKEMYKPLVEIIKDHPAFFAYDLADEPAWAGNNISAFAAGAYFLRENDPNHPIYSNQAPRGSIEQFRRWYRFVDIGGSDIYPWWNGDPDLHSDLPNKTFSVVGDECVKNITAIGHGKPVLMTIQAFGWSDGRTDPQSKAKGYGYPPTNVLRFMAYDAITSGANGIMFYQDHRYPNIDPRVKPVSLELSAIHDVLASPTLTSKYARSLDKRIKLITRKHGKDTYIIAVNTTGQSVRANIETPVQSSIWNVRFENKTVLSKNRIITDDFEPWDVNIYTDR